MSVGDTLTGVFFARKGVCLNRERIGRRGVGRTNEIATMKADDDGMFAWLDICRDEDIDRDGVVVDGLIYDIVDVESGESVLDGCDLGGIHADELFDNNTIKKYR